MTDWARATLGIDCGACGAKSAIASLDAQVACLHCATVHDVAGAALDRALGELHDAAADDKRVARQIGEIVFAGERSTPVCDRCGAEVTTAEADGHVTATCTKCAAVTTHRPPLAWRGVNGSVAAVLFDDSRDDVAPAKVTEQDGRATLGCAACGAAIDAPADRSVVTCPYCQASSYIPLSAQPRARNGPASRPMWIRFLGRSPEQLATARHEEQMSESLKAADREETIAMVIIGGSIVFSVVAGLGYLVYRLVS